MKTPSRDEVMDIALLLNLLRVVFLMEHGREPFQGEALYCSSKKNLPSFAEAFATPVSLMGEMGFEPALINAIRDGVWSSTIWDFMVNNPLETKELLDYVSDLDSFSTRQKLHGRRRRCR
jgi:hypothetical protein